MQVSFIRRGATVHIPVSHRACVVFGNECYRRTVLQWRFGRCHPLLEPTLRQYRSVRFIWYVCNVKSLKKSLFIKILYLRVIQNLGFEICWQGHSCFGVEVGGRCSQTILICEGQILVNTWKLLKVTIHFVTRSSSCLLLVVITQHPLCSNDSSLCLDPGVLTGSMEGHTDAVWGLSIHSQRLQLLSCSADCTVKLWSPTSKVPLVSTYVSEQGTSWN